MADYGTTASTYSPGVVSYSGRIGKIAKSIVDGVAIPSKFNSLFKPMSEYGRDLEITLYEQATGQLYNADNEAAANNPAVAGSLLFKTWLKKVYGVKIDENLINESSINAQNANDNAAAIVQTQYEGANYDKNRAVVGTFHDALTLVPAPKLKKLSGIRYEETEAAALKLVLKIKNTATLVRAGSPTVNASSVQTAAKGKIIMIIPERLKNFIDTYGRSQAEQEPFLRYGVDEVITYTEAEDPDHDIIESGTIIIFDEMYTQFYEKPVHYREKLVAGCDNVKAYLFTRQMFAICPLFNAAAFECNDLITA